MLNEYSTNYRDSVNQILLINNSGIILDNNTTIFNAINGKHVSELHPFFHTISSLLLNETTTHEFYCVNLDVGSRNYIIDFTLKTFKDDDNSILIVHDLTKQYNTYQKVAQLRNESKLQSEVLAYKNELLEKREVFKNNFIANFSHEIRMPINTISGATILLESSNLSQTQLYNLNVIKSSNEKLKYMINDILDLSKIETGYLSIVENELSLVEELQTIVDVYTKKCTHKGLTLETEIDKKCPEFVISDKFRLSQISSNLIGNAIKFTNSGSIALKVKLLSKTKKTAKIEFTVKDTGIGIEQNKIDFIFDSFYQINNKQANKGAGLGLAIVKQLVEALNGTINIISTIDKGTLFTVVLPLKIAQTQEKTPIELQLKTKKDYDYKVLVGETVKKDQIAITKLLNDTGYDCVIVDNGDDIINQLHKSKFDIVLLNLSLPKMDGYDVTRYIRFSEFIQFTKIPIIALTDTPSKEEEVSCLEKQMNGYIGKPFTNNNLLDCIKNNL